LLGLYICFNSLAKEKVSYEKELEKQQQKVVNMKAENPDDYDIRKQVSDSCCLYNALISELVKWNTQLVLYVSCRDGLKTLTPKTETRPRRLL